MSWISVLAAVVLIAHGLIHLIGTTVYLRLGQIKGFAYKTTLLGGRCGRSLAWGSSSQRLAC